jgi:hypothetical protein
MTVSQYAASCARYYADVADVGYSQPDRWTFYDQSDWDGWLVQSPANADCSALVAGCYNLAAHHEWGEPFTAGYFPRSTWTGSLREECSARNFADISDQWTGNEPDGGFEIGDIVLSEEASGGRGHVAMVTGLGPTILSEAWIAEDGSIDGYLGDQTGSEVRSIEYNQHPYTQAAAWTHCFRRRDNHGSSAPSHREENGAATSIQDAVLRAADAVGCPWWAALGALKMETGEAGANIYGHDAGGACSGWGEVTRDNFLNYFWPIVSEWGTSNGVGPLQVTYNGYFINDPNREWWDPQKSSEVGCAILKGLIQSEGDSYEDLKRVGSRYNSGSADGAYEAYGIPFSEACRYWYDKGRPSQGSSDGGEELEVSYATDLLAEMKDRLVEISDQTGAGIAGRRFDGPLVGWLKDISYKQDKLQKSLDEIKDKLGESK